MSNIIKTRTKGNLIVISGPSGAGKGTVIKGLREINKDIWLSISMTSRGIRSNDIPNETYFFVTKDEFETRINDGVFLEYAVYNGNYYGTPKSMVEEMLNAGKDVILEIDIQGALQVKENYEEGIFIFIMPPSMKILRDRLVKRGTESKEKIIERFTTAYKEMNEITKYNYVVVNDDIDLAIKKVESIILSEKCRVDRIEEVDLNNKEELIHELIVNDNI